MVFPEKPKGEELFSWWPQASSNPCPNSCPSWWTWAVPWPSSTATAGWIGSWPPWRPGTAGGGGFLVLDGDPKMGGKWWKMVENHRKTQGKWWLNGISWDLPSGNLFRNYGKIHHFEWKYSRTFYGHFQWLCQSSPEGKYGLLDVEFRGGEIMRWASHEHPMRRMLIPRWWWWKAWWAWSPSPLTSFMKFHSSWGSWGDLPAHNLEKTYHIVYISIHLSNEQQSRRSNDHGGGDWKPILFCLLLYVVSCFLLDDL